MDIREDIKVLENLRDAFEQQLINDGFIEHNGYSLKRDNINAYIDERVECAWFACLQGYELAKASVVEGFVLMPKDPTKDTLIEIASVCIGHDFANLDEAKELYKAAIKAQEPSTHQSPDIKYDTTYVIEVVGYTQIEDARNLLNQKGYKTWGFTDKENIDEFSTYIICACPTLSSEGVVLAKQTYASLDQSKFKYVLTKIEDFPLAQELSND